MTEAGDPRRPEGLLTQKQYAKLRGWSKQYVNQLVSKGRIRLHDGLVDPAAADLALGRSRDPSRAAPFRTDTMGAATPTITEEDAASRVHGSFARARTVREHYRAMREKFEYEITRGRYVEAAEVEAEQFALGRRVRQRMLASVQDIASAVASAVGVEPRQIVVLVEPVIRRQLDDLAIEIEQGPADEETALEDAEQPEASSDTAAGHN